MIYLTRSTFCAGTMKQFSRIMNAVEMPDQLAENLVMFIRQNKGNLSKKRRTDEFEKLRDDEVVLLEGIVRDTFAGFEGVGSRAADPTSRS